MSNLLESLSKLSLCMIVKNEKENLPRCLVSVKPYVDEMIVVDTGSDDGTPEIAANYGANVKNFQWCDDFAAARNYAISQASGNWILVLDADEELIVNSAEDFLNQLASQPDVKLYSISLTDVKGEVGLTPAWVPRLFRNIPGLRYEGCYHEQVKYNEQAISKNQVGYLQSIKILHYGYSHEELFKKNLKRNIPILERIRQNEGLNLMLLYCLAGMYNNTQQTEKAQDCYAEALNKLLPNLIDDCPPEDFVFVPSLMFTLGSQSLQQDDYETARLLCQRGLEWFPNYPPLNYLAGATLKALGFSLGAIAYLETCIQLGQDNSYYKGEPFELGYMTTFPAYDMGCIYLDEKRPQDALAAFELTLSFAPNFQAARQKIEQIKQLYDTV